MTRWSRVDGFSETEEQMTLHPERASSGGSESTDTVFPYFREKLARK